MKVILLVGTKKHIVFSGQPRKCTDYIARAKAGAIKRGHTPEITLTGFKYLSASKRLELKIEPRGY